MNIEQSFPRHHGLIAAFVESLPASSRTDFHRALEFTEHRWPNKSCSVVGFYTGLPHGYRKTQIVVFADFGVAGKALPNSWVARIPLKDETVNPLTIFLPFTTKREDVAAELVLEGKKTWRPRDLNNFLDDPSRYLKQ